MQNLLALGMPMGYEWIVIAIFGLILFGKRLPEVGRSLGKGIVEFKKGIKGIEEEVNDAAHDRPPAPAKPALEAGHKFDPYTGKPLNNVSEER